MSEALRLLLCVGCIVTTHSLIINHPHPRPHPDGDSMPVADAIYVIYYGACYYSTKETKSEMCEQGAGCWTQQDKLVWGKGSCPSGTTAINWDTSSHRACGKQCKDASLTVHSGFQQKQPIPHLAQSWVAQSTGDGVPGATGKESYLYEGCKKPSDDCMNAHIFDYGASNCIKIEIDAGFKSEFSGTWLLKCDAVDCCYEGDRNREPADIKKWDIYHPTGHFDPLRRKVTYLGKHQTTELNGKAVPNADTWAEIDHLPFTKEAVNYTYYVTTDAANETISHRIDFTAPGGKSASGSILYGDFQVQHNLTAFRKAIQQYVPSECLKPNTLACNGKHSRKWNSRLPVSFGYTQQVTANDTTAA